MSRFPQLNKPGPTLLLDLINQTNKLDLDPDDITFGIPTPVVLEDSPFINTQIEVEGRQGVLIPSQSICYRRIQLDRLFLNENTVFVVESVGGYVSTDYLIGLINDRFGIAISEDDVVEANYQITPGFPSVVTLEAHPSSYTYVGAAEFTLHDENVPTPEEQILGLIRPYVWYRLNDVTPNGVVHDLSGNEWHGAYSSTVVAGESFTTDGGSLAPLGNTSTGYFTFPSGGWTSGAAALEDGLLFSIVVGPYEQALAKTGWQYLIGRIDAGVSPVFKGWACSTHGTVFRFNTSNSQPSSGVDALTTPNNTEPHMITVTCRFNNGNYYWRSYIDGVMVETRTTTDPWTYITGETWRGGSPQNYPSSYGRAMPMSEVIAAPGFSSDEEADAAVAMLYQILFGTAGS